MMLRGRVGGLTGGGGGGGGCNFCTCGTGLGVCGCDGGCTGAGGRGRDMASCVKLGVDGLFCGAVFTLFVLAAVLKEIQIF